MPDLQTSFPNSVFSHGFGDDVVTGLRIYVDSGRTNASDGNDGETPREPMATLNGAINRVSANNGDYIYLMPGHAETISADAATDPGPDLTVAGVTVIGLGKGSDRPTFTFDNTAADFKLNAANCKVHNILFVAGVNQQVMGIEVSGVDCEISHCELRNDGTNEFLIPISIGLASNDSDRLWVHHCRLISDTAASTSGISMAALQAGVVIEENYIRGDWSDSCINSTVIHTDCVVRSNYLQNDNDGDHAIQFTTTSTGIIHDNLLVTNAIATAMDQGSCFASGNMYYDDGDTDATGTPVPTTDVTGGTSLATVSAQHTVPSADATANVDMGDVIGNKTDTASVVPAANDSLVSYLKGIQASSVMSLAKTDGAVLTGVDNLFVVADGPIHVISIIGLVTTVIGGTANGTLQCVVTTPSATVGMSTTVAINSDAEGTMYHFLGEGGVLTPVDAGLLFLPLDDAADGTDKPTQWLVPIGTVVFLGSAAQTGVIRWVMTYYNHSGATVTVAS